MTRRLQAEFEELARLPPAEQNHYADLICALKWAELKQSVEHYAFLRDHLEVIAWDVETAGEGLQSEG